MVQSSHHYYFKFLHTLAILIIVTFIIQIRYFCVFSEKVVPFIVPTPGLEENLITTRREGGKRKKTLLKGRNLQQVQAQGGRPSAATGWGW